MSLVAAICTQCGAQIEVDDTHEAGICKHCGTAFITEKAINKYTFNVQNASFNVSGINVENLLQRALEFERNGDNEKALEYYNRVLDEDINHAIARDGVKRLSSIINQVNIGGVVLPAELGTPILNSVHAGKKVQAIKELREATGLGLKEAKDAIELYEKSITEVTYTNITIETKPSKSGCYIATCVYGSYDCPQVWTLRRFRDYTLDKTWYGRIFIKTYYAISPTLVKLFGNYKWFTAFWKNFLDTIVSRLNSQGIESTKYTDKYISHPNR